jgi:hypothetical protein
MRANPLTTMAISLRVSFGRALLSSQTIERSAGLVYVADLTKPLKQIQSWRGVYVFKFLKICFSTRKTGSPGLTFWQSMVTLSASETIPDDLNGRTDHLHIS